MRPQDLRELCAAADSKDLNALRQAVWNLEQDQASVPILSKVLLEEWHDLQEDIVFELGLIGDPSAIPAITKAVTIPFANLIEWDNLHEFQRKCAYALARIGTAEARSVLEALAVHSDPYLREYGEEILQKWPLPHSRE